MVRAPKSPRLWTPQCRRQIESFLLNFSERSRSRTDHGADINSAPAFQDNRYSSTWFLAFPRTNNRSHRPDSWSVFSPPNISSLSPSPSCCTYRWRPGGERQRQHLCGGILTLSTLFDPKPVIAKLTSCSTSSLTSACVIAFIITTFMYLPAGTL